MNSSARKAGGASFQPEGRGTSCGAEASPSLSIACLLGARCANSEGVPEPRGRERPSRERRADRPNRCAPAPGVSDGAERTGARGDRTSALGRRSTSRRQYVGRPPSKQSSRDARWRGRRQRSTTSLPAGRQSGTRIPRARRSGRVQRTAARAAGERSELRVERKAGRRLAAWRGASAYSNAC